MHLRSLSASPTLPASTAPPPPADSTTDPNSHARLEPSVTAHHPTSTESPRTPPSTPITTYNREQPTTMWALTASKLERAAQAQLTGSRGSSGLRELVLLSNVWGAARPFWDQEQAERERIERRRKENEERWLDGVLEEMLEEEEGDEDFVSLTLVERERKEVGDSGFLEEDEGKRRRESLHAIDVEEETQPFGVDSAATDFPLPPSPPLPPRSPPIDLPSPNRSAHQHHLPFSLSADLSSSPPLHLPVLTPDSTPPNPSFANLMSTSADSVDSDLEDSYQWIQDRDQKLGLGLRALDLSPPSLGMKKRGGDPFSLDMLALSHGLHHPSSSFSSSSETIPFPFGPERPPPTSLALTLSTAAPFQAQAQAAQNWTPRPPRCLSLPSLRAKAASFVGAEQSGPNLVPRFEGGIGKSFYDCVDFGRPPSPSSSSSSPDRTTSDDDSPSHLALVLARPRPLAPPHLGASWGHEERGRRLLDE